MIHDRTANSNKTDLHFDMCRRSQFATRIANCPLYYVTATLLRRDIHRGQPAPRWSGRDRLFSLPRQGDQVFPPPVHTTGRPRTRITSLLLLRVSYCSMIVDSCPRFYARCVQYAASSSFILFPFRFFSLCINHDCRIITLVVVSNIPSRFSFRALRS